MSNVIGQVEVEVNANLSVSQNTFKTCMSLIAMYMNNNGNKVMVITCGEEFLAGYATQVFGTEEEFWEFLGGQVNRRG